MKLTFVTGNPGKLMEARSILARAGVTVAGCGMDFDEPRSTDLAIIAKAKLAQAKSVLEPPFFVQDSAFYIDALGGFPATYVNFALATVGVGGILKLMEGAKDRRCRFRQCVALFDGEKETYFTSETPGTLALAEHGGERPEQLSALWRIFIPQGAQCTLAQYAPEDLSALQRAGGRALVQLAEHLAARQHRAYPHNDEPFAGLEGEE